MNLDMAKKKKTSRKNNSKNGTSNYKKKTKN